MPTNVFKVTDHGQLIERYASGITIAHSTDGNEGQRYWLRHLPPSHHYAPEVGGHFPGTINRSHVSLTGTYKKRPGAYADLAPMGAF